jgi:hypothetical protein
MREREERREKGEREREREEKRKGGERVRIENISE